MLFFRRKPTKQALSLQYGDKYAVKNPERTLSDGSQEEVERLLLDTSQKILIRAGNREEDDVTIATETVKGLPLCDIILNCICK